MDKLARSSIRFSDFHVNPFCSPTRAALMTGRMPDRTGVTSTNFQRNYLRRDEVLMPEYFKASGARCGTPDREVRQALFPTPSFLTPEGRSFRDLPFSEPFEEDGRFRIILLSGTTFFRIFWVGGLNSLGGELFLKAGLFL